MHARRSGSALRAGNALRAVAAILMGSSLTSSVCLAASPADLLGSLIGSVADNSGIPQMGALVRLYNRHDKMVEQALTGADGGFVFPALNPGPYSIRVSLSSFVPAVRKNIAVQPGMQSVLAINMATLLSSVELVYTSRNPGTLMSDDWKWVLRSQMTTRPVIRLLPGVDISDPNSAGRTASAVFAGTHGILKLSAGENANPFTSVGNQPDLGTTFALATSVFGNNQVQFAGNFGYGLSSDAPAAGFRTSFSRSAGGPELKLTMQQVGLAGMRGPAGIGQPNGGLLLRTMSVTAIERLSLMEGLDLDYGASLDSVSYLDRLNFFSPFARLRQRIGSGTLDVGYSSGAPPVELLNRDGDDASLQNDVAALSMLPRVSLRNGRAHVQRTENMEVGYRIQVGSRTYSIGAYHEFVRNGAVTLAAQPTPYFPGDLLPEISSNSSVFNIGNYSRSGFTASATQSLGEGWSATVAAGRGGVLTTDGDTMQSATPDELRRMIRRAQRMWARGIVAGTVPVIGTRFVTSYEWSDATTLTPGHVYLTQKIYPETGLNVRLRQPLPGRSYLRGRLEATAELRNLLAQGYLPITSSDGNRIVLAHFPRAVRGGLAFIF